MSNDWKEEILSQVDDEIGPDNMTRGEAIEAVEELIGSLQVRLEAMRSEEADEG
jgi:hypothetical protein